MPEHRLSWWGGPLTISVAIVAVLGVQWVAAAILDPRPAFLDGYLEPAVITGALVAAAVAVCAVIAREAAHPRATFVKGATAALLLSLVPDVAVGMGWLFAREGWRLATVFMLQHVAAWAVCVVLLPRCMRRVPV